MSESSNKELQKRVLELEKEGSLVIPVMTGVLKRSFSTPDHGNYQRAKRVHPVDKLKCYEDINKHMEDKTPVYLNEHRVLCKDNT